MTGEDLHLTLGIEPCIYRPTTSWYDALPIPPQSLHSTADILLSKGGGLVCFCFGFYNMLDTLIVA